MINKGNQKWANNKIKSIGRQHGIFLRVWDVCDRKVLLSIKTFLVAEHLTNYLNSWTQFSHNGSMGMILLRWILWSSADQTLPVSVSSYFCGKQVDNLLSQMLRATYISEFNFMLLCFKCIKQPSMVCSSKHTSLSHRELDRFSNKTKFSHADSARFPA